MKKMVMAALLATVVCAQAQVPLPSSTAPSTVKKEWVQKILVLQQPAIESMARNLVEQPAVQMMQATGRAIQQVPEEKRETVGKTIEADIKKYVDESFPLARERAVKIAPATLGSVLEEKFTEDELKQLVNWLESPVNKKYLQLGPEMQANFMQKLVDEVRPTLDPKLQALESRVRVLLGVSPTAAASAAQTSVPTAPQAVKKPNNK
jgi:uncharacterized protein